MLVRCTDHPGRCGATTPQRPSFGRFGVELPIEKVFVLVYLLAHLLPFPAAADLREQVILLLRPPQTMDEVIVAASGYLKESAHDGYRIFVPVPVDNCVFCPWPHFLV